MPAGILTVTILVAATTIDDAIWLIPYCTSPQLPFYTKAVHALVFIATLELMAIFCSVAAFLFQDLILHAKKKPKNGDGDHNDDDADVKFILGLAGAILCWILAIGLFVKKMNKKKRRAAIKKEKEAKAAAANAAIDSSDLALVDEEGGGRGDDDGDGDAPSPSVPVEENPLMETNAKGNGDNDDASSSSSSSSSSGGASNGRDIPTTPSIRMVLSLTMLGALDEISYFPALLVGNVFTPVQLCIGTILASMVVLVIVLFFLTKFQPLVDFLDSIPLYGIVGMFAIILTLGLIVPL